MPGAEAGFKLIRCFSGSIIPQQAPCDQPCDRQCDKPVEIRMFLQQHPIEPTGLIVLRVGIVIPALEYAELWGAKKDTGA